MNKPSSTKPKITRTSIVNVLNGETVSPPPVWLMRQAGRYLPEYRKLREKAGSFLDLCGIPELAAEVTLQPIRRFDFDAAILFADILLLPRALGQPLEFRENEGPRLDPLVGDAALDGLRQRLESGAAMDALSPVFDTVARVRSGLDGGKALIGFCGAPWTVATYMVQGRSSPDQAEVRLRAYEQGPWFSRLIDILVEASVGYLSRQIEAGADAVQIFDTWAGALSADGFEKWVTAPTRRIVGALREKHGAVPVIGFPKGAGAGASGYVRETGVQGLGVDFTQPLSYIRDDLQKLCAVQGSLDPLLLVAGGAALDARVAEIVETLGHGPFIFNLGHGIVPQTPIAHVERLVTRVRGGQV